MSNAGKSFIAAALCRIFHQDGCSCAPFKSQNMALNSFVTADGLEIGRAQAMQAEAAGVEPSVLMNPILLKPTSNVGSQVIVNGRVRADMKAAEYFRHKKALIPEITAAYNALAAEHDIIVIEGAGSPCELNLKADDIVNMGMAKLARSPVILVGDIDRGGIFPQLLGTLMLLEEDERQMVKGLLVNKFRGDIGLFSSGTQILTERGGKPVIGVVPYMDTDIDDEDSLSDKLEKNTADGVIDIAVIRLPKISNFTDFDVFSQYDGVSVRYVERVSQLGGPDMIILPGTKSTIGDMKWLRESGLEAGIKKCVSNGVPLFGICGGYQMLGKKITDPLGAEGGGSIDGMGLLNCVTSFCAEKKRCRTQGKFENVGGIFSALTSKEFYGYEIHMGNTESQGNRLLDCGGTYEGSVYGCYIHGIFDSTQVSSEIVRALYERKGIRFNNSVLDRNAYKQLQYDRLAENVRKNIDMPLVYRILEEGI